MSKVSNKQGPNTPAGKAKSAANSTVHGLRSNHISTTEQKAIYDSFLKELFEFYNPQSPLEKLELERIATCKAKLQTLYALENAKLNVMYREYGSNPQQLLKKYGSLDPLVKGMMYELIRWKTLILPCNLDADTLEKIHLEIESFSGEISDEAHLKKVFPNLVSYLLSFDSEEEYLDRRLIAISEKIIRSINRGEDYCEFMASLLPDIQKESDPELTDEQIEFENQIREHQLQSKKQGDVKKLNINLDTIGFKDGKHLQKVLRPFSDLFLAYMQAIRLSKDSQIFIEEKRAALSLPQDEADLLMRYQTTWERRLSSSIGEFLRLQELSRAKSTRSIE